MRVEVEATANGLNPEGTISSNQIVFPTHKDVGLIFLEVLRDRAYTNREVISFPEARRVLSWYRVGRYEFNELLNDWQRSGYIKIVPFRGLIIKKGGQQ